MIQNVKPEVREYIEKNIFPKYNRNEIAHGIEHINYVIRRSFEIMEQNDLDVDDDMVYVIAAYHDIGHYIDPKKHEIISAEIFEEDKEIAQFFTDEQLQIIKEAIEDHRASANNEPRSVYGKIVSSADRNNTVEACLERSYFYGKRLNLEATERELYERAYEHLKMKFGENGYAKFFFKDKEYDEFLEKIRKVLKDKTEFCKIQDNYIKGLINKKKEENDDESYTEKIH